MTTDNNETGIEHMDGEPNVYLPKTVEEAIAAIAAVRKFEAENPTMKGAKGVIVTNAFFDDMLRRFVALEGVVKGGAAFKKDGNVRKNG